MGSPFHETPNIDKLYAAGMTFPNGYSACTVCSPSRAAILTGCYPGRTHVTDWIAGHNKPFAKLAIPDWNMKMEHERITLAEALKEQGYATQFVGKWHLMPLNQPELMDQHYPESHGFDINIAGREWGQPKGPGKYFYPWDMPNLEGGKEGDFLTDRLTDYAVDFIGRHKSDPFLVYFSYYTVHGPIMGKPELVKKYEDKQQTGDFNAYNPKYAAMVQSLDESVGRVMDKLKETGQLDNTVIIFTGDNGADAHLYCGGLKGYKGYSHEGGTREPFIIKAPGIKPGTCDVPVIGMDFYPTILELIGAPLKPDQHLDGVSLVPLLQRTGKIKERSLYWHYPHYHRTNPYGAVRNGDWKLIEFFEDGALELYNLKDDPHEEKNLVQANPEKAAELLKELKAWRANVNAQMPTPNPAYNPQSADGKSKASKKKSNSKPVRKPGNVASVTASSVQPNNEPENAVDGDPKSRWAASNGTFSQWLEVEFKEPKKGKGVRIAFRTETVIKYQVACRKGDGEWKVVADQGKNDLPVLVVEHAIPVEFDSLKVTVLDVGKGWATIADLKLY
jgi:arylsulfatase A-like enzyme